MKQKLTVIVHKFNRSLLLVKTQSDLSTLLGVSISTIKRSYNTVGIYDTDIYTIYVGVEYYDNGIETKYRRDVVPPIAKVYNKTERTNVSHDIAQKNYSNHDIAHPIEEELDDDTIIPSQFDQFYSNKTLEELLKYRAKWSLHPTRMTYITKYGKIRQGVIE